MRFAAFVFSLLLALPASAQVTTRPPGQTALPFTGGTITAPLLGPTGCTNPAYSFTVDADAGLCSSGADSLNLQLSVAPAASTGSLSLNTSAAALNFTGAGFLVSGFAASDGQARLRTDGVFRLTVDTTSVTSTLPVIVPAGSAAAPSLAFTGGTTTGIYGSGTTFQVSVGGTERARVTTSQILATTVGTEGAPNFSSTNDSNTGAFLPGGDSYRISAGGTEVASWGTTEMRTTLQTLGQNGTAALPAYSFTAQTNMGMFRDSVTGELGLVKFGALGLRVSGVTGAYHPADPRTIADNAVPATPATLTLIPTSGTVTITCNDGDGCDVTLSETSIPTGAMARITNLSANAVNFADTAGVSELAGAFAMGQYDVLTVMYVGTTWVEVSRSNN